MKFKNKFEIRQCKRLDGQFFENEYELVKWTDDSHCVVIGFLIYNPSEQGFDFKGVGLRYQAFHEEGIDEYIIKMADLLSFAIKSSGEEYRYNE